MSWSFVARVVLSKFELLICQSIAQLLLAFEEQFASIAPNEDSPVPPQNNEEKNAKKSKKKRKGKVEKVSKASKVKAKPKAKKKPRH